MEERGRVVVLGWLCATCWNEALLPMAEADMARSMPEPDPEDLTFYQPPLCPDCGAELEYYQTNYGRWIALEPYEAPAKEIPSRFRWRLQTRQARHSPVVIAVAAMRITGDVPAEELVRPAHPARCPAPNAQDLVHDEHLRDLERARRRADPGDDQRAPG